MIPSAPTPPETLRVALGARSYEIAIGAGNLAQAGEFVVARGTRTHAVVVADGNVADSHAAVAAESLRRRGIRAEVLVVPPGEPSKSVAEAERLWGELVACGADRQSAVVAVGGGVVGDLAGFAAATFARGVDFFQIPTTLLAQVDSSVGGKVGINLPGAKNLVGAFWQPRGVLIDTATLATLPEREYLSGLAEVVKYGVILDEAFFTCLETRAALLRQRDGNTLRQVVARCCQLKAQVVERDEREETGLRAVLNYGHTFAHAFEAVAGYGELLHGEAVSLGMARAARLAQRLGRVPAAFVARQEALLVALGLPVANAPGSAAALLAAMRHDKKVSHGRLRFVLPSRMGEVALVGDVDEALVREALAMP